MRMGSDIEPLSPIEVCSPHLIKEDEGTDHSTFFARQSATNSKAITQITHARNDDQFQRVAGSLVFRVLDRPKATNSLRTPVLTTASRWAIHRNHSSSCDLVFWGRCGRHV